LRKKHKTIQGRILSGGTMYTLRRDWEAVAGMKPMGDFRINLPNNERVLHGVIESLRVNPNTKLVEVDLAWVAEMKLIGNQEDGRWFRAPDSMRRLVLLPNTPYNFCTDAFGSLFHFGKPKERGGRPGIGFLYLEPVGRLTLDQVRD